MHVWVELRDGRPSFRALPELTFDGSRISDTGILFVPPSVFSRSRTTLRSWGTGSSLMFCRHHSEHWGLYTFDSDPCMSGSVVRPYDWVVEIIFGAGS